MQVEGSVPAGEPCTQIRTIVNYLLQETIFHENIVTGETFKDLLFVLLGLLKMISLNKGTGRDSEILNWMLGVTALINLAIRNGFSQIKGSVTISDLLSDQQILPLPLGPTPQHTVLTVSMVLRAPALMQWCYRCFHGDDLLSRDFTYILVGFLSCFTILSILFLCDPDRTALSRLNQHHLNPRLELMKSSFAWITMT